MLNTDSVLWQNTVTGHFKKYNGRSFKKKKDVYKIYINWIKFTNFNTSVFSVLNVLQSCITFSSNKVI